MMKCKFKKVNNRQDPGYNYSLVPNDKNAHKGMFPHSTTRARGRVPEMLYIFVQQSVYKSLLSNESKIRILKYSNILK